MPHALNMTMPLKQDEGSLQALQQLKATFADTFQKEIGNALAESNIVHYARILILDDKYIQILTEYDGDKINYALFFYRKLPNVFRGIFSLVEGAPAIDDLMQCEDLFVATSKSFDVRALGKKDDDDEAGWLFSAFEDKTVNDIKLALSK